MAVLQCTAIDPTNKEAPAAANHHPATSPTAVCPDAAMGPNEALARPPAALASEASGMDDLESEASAGTRLTYLALAAMAEVSSTPMPRLPPIDDYGINDGVIWCEYCKRYLNGPVLYGDHLVGKLHRHNVNNHKKAAACSQSIPPAGFPSFG